MGSVQVIFKNWAYPKNSYNFTSIRDSANFRYLGLDWSLVFENSELNFGFWDQLKYCGHCINDNDAKIP